MGLLDAAEKKNSHDVMEPEGPEAELIQELDTAGTALRDRILRIPPGANVPYTALGLLKAYGSFQAGICLYLEDGCYISYASVGIGIEKITIPYDHVFTPDRTAVNYFRFDEEEKKQLEFLDCGMDIWCFLIDRENPCKYILILGCTGSLLLNPHSISLILQSIQSIISPKERKEPEPEIITVNEVINVNQSEPQPALQPDLQSGLQPALEKYFDMNETSEGLIIDIPSDKTNWILKLKNMISHFAMVEPLPGDYCLVIFPKSYDSGLISHRLKNSLKTGISLVFSCENPAEALKAIQPFC